MIRNRLRRNSEHSTFELLSDISLSTLGLFLLFFIVYSLVFNSSSISLLKEVNKWKTRVSDVEQQNYNLSADKLRLSKENERLNQNLNEANQRASNAEREKQQEIEKNQYTGYYKGSEEGRFYYGSCYGDYETIQKEITLTYIQSSNTIIYSSRSYRGTITYKISGSLQGNTFSGEFPDYQSTPGIKLCSSSSNKFYVDFFSDRAEVHDNSSSGSRTTLSKQN